MLSADYKVSTTTMKELKADEKKTLFPFHRIDMIVGTPTLDPFFKLGIQAICKSYLSVRHKDVSSFIEQDAFLHFTCGRCVSTPPIQGANPVFGNKANDIACDQTTANHQLAMYFFLNCNKTKVVMKTLIDNAIIPT